MVDTRKTTTRNVYSAMDNELNVVDGYRILKTLGKGGESVVKLVSNQQGEQFAMKIFKTDHTEKSKLVIEKASAELEIVQKLNFESLPIYYEFKADAVWTRSSGLQQHVCYLLMEFIEGCSLSDFIETVSSQHEKYLRYIFRDVIRTIYKLHQAGISHRDIKPQNILIQFQSNQLAKW